jgi:hypothetical protein
MAKTEQELRSEAVRRRLAGESPAEIARSLGRSRQWVAKWVRRHGSGEEHWAVGARRGPRRGANRTPAEVEALVLGVRERLAENPWAQVGAPAIAWELEKLGAWAPPLRTIERILQRGGLTERSRPRRRQPKGIPYPAQLAQRPGEIHEADLVGPRHLAGGVRFYALNAVDLAPHRAAIEIVEDKLDEGIARGLIALWERLGVPARVKFDNGGPFICPRGLGLVIRLCLHQGVTPVFIPQGEPWRNGTVERFNDTFDKRFLRQERFTSLAQLRERSRAFERFHNEHHRYRATGGRTPDECAGAQLRRPSPIERLPHGWPPTGRIEFVRFIRSDRKLRIMRRALTMPDGAVYEYVTAVLDFGVPMADGNLRVVHRDGELIATASLKIGGR